MDMPLFIKKTETKPIIVKYPPQSLGGLALGLTGVSNQFLASELLLGSPNLLRTVGAWCCTIIACILLIASFTLFVRQGWGAFTKSFQHHVNGPLCATVPMALMNICFSLQMLIMTEANSNVIVPLQVLWTIGVGLQLFCMVTFILINLKKYFQSTLCWDIVNPAWFVPPVGILVASVSGMLFNSLLAEICFWIGSSNLWILCPIILYSYFFTKPLPARPAKGVHTDCFGRSLRHPVNGILMAPAALCYLAYNAVYPQVNLSSDIFALFQLILAVMMGCLSLWEFSRFLYPPFSPALSACTFPTCLLSLCCFTIYNLASSEGIMSLLILSSIAFTLSFLTTRRVRPVDN